MRVILEGNDRDVLNIMQENRIRVERGMVKFVPSNEEVSDDKASGVEDNKIVDLTVDEKKPKRVAKKK